MFEVLLPELLVLSWLQPFVAAGAFSALVYFAGCYMVPIASPALMQIGLVGKDRLKPGQDKPIPESLGVVIGVIYIFGVLLFTPFALSTGGLAAYLSGVLSIQSMVMLGFADDLFDLRWRHKFFLPAIAAIPMLIVYYIEHGNTHIAVPPVLARALAVPSAVDMGWLYYVYMAMVAIFATNCINIYAGINGLEVGQTVVVAGSVLLNDLYYIVSFWVWPHVTISLETFRAHSLSLYFVLPLLAASLALLKFNWYPARVFVGDTFCYFADMVLAVVGISGHFSKTMLSLILPQIANFVYSLPQLFRIVPCPRHRMPLIDAKTGKLLPSRFSYRGLAAYKVLVLRALAAVGLLKLWEESEEASNMTLINLALVHLGPLKESHLTTALLVLQSICCGLALVGRHMLGRLLFGYDNVVTH